MEIFSALRGILIFQYLPGVGLFPSTDILDDELSRLSSLSSFKSLTSIAPVTWEWKEVSEDMVHEGFSRIVSLTGTERFVLSASLAGANWSSKTIQNPSKGSKL